MNAVFDTMIVTLVVESINHEERKCTVNYTFRTEKELIETNTIEDVVISGLAMYRFLHNQNFVLGKKYQAMNKSKVYLDCPIQLIRTSTKDDKLLFILKVVDEGNSYIREFTTPSGNIVKSRFFKGIMSKKWLRYRDYFDYSKERRAKRKAEENI
tara:strand:- start:358 stop:822 length:465 start_codon:yes stop_codon:yes gene_type:complete